MTPTPVAASRGRARGAFTVAELLLSLSLTAMIGLAVVSMLYGSGVATSEQHDRRRALHGRQIATERIGSLLRSSGAVLDSSPDGVLLWRHDLDRDRLPRLSEVCLLSWNADDGSLVVHEPVSSLPAGSDTAFDWSADFRALAQSLPGSAAFHESVLMKRVTGWNVEIAPDGPHATKIIVVSVSFSTDSGESSASVVASLRCAMQ